MQPYDSGRSTLSTTALSADSPRKKKERNTFLFSDKTSVGSCTFIVAHSTEINAKPSRHYNRVRGISRILPKSTNDFCLNVNNYSALSQRLDIAGQLTTFFASSKAYEMMSARGS